MPARALLLFKKAETNLCMLGADGPLSAAGTPPPRKQKNPHVREARRSLLCDQPGIRSILPDRLAVARIGAGRNMLACLQPITIRRLDGLEIRRRPVPGARRQEAFRLGGENTTGQTSKRQHLVDGVEANLAVGELDVPRLRPVLFCSWHTHSVRP